MCIIPKKKLENLKRTRLHERWQKRYDRAWAIARWKAYNSYHEDICACTPEFYFKSELDGLKKLPKSYYQKKYEQL